VSFVSTAAPRRPHLRGALGRFARLTFPFWERLGLHVTPVHFYEPVPDTTALAEDLWSTRSELVGIDMNDDGQRRLLRGFLAFKREYDAFPGEPTPGSSRFHLGNGLFESVDAEVLYCMVRSFKPRRLLEIGSGHSTLVAAQAILANTRDDPAYRCELRSIDPYPSPVLAGGVPGLSRQVPVPVQDVPLSDFMELGEDDILFIDSSHVLRIGSDVQYEYLEILPRLRPGVVVHVHDVFLPAQYPRDWVLGQHRFWNEQYLLQAFLTGNSSFEVLWGGSYMHLTHPDELEAAFASYRAAETRPGSFWMRRRTSAAPPGPGGSGPGGGGG